MGEVFLIKNINIYLYIGQMGEISMSRAISPYNGGGSGYLYSQENAVSGGGATDIRLSNGEWNNTTSLRSRIIVSAGGGGIDTYVGNAGILGIRGAAGGLFSERGTTGAFSSSYYSGDMSGYSANQTNPGKNYNDVENGGFGFGGKAINTGYLRTSSGGGSGYYGGGSGNTVRTHNSGGGAGGSSYISGHTGCVAITSETDQTPKTGCTTGTTDNNCSIHYSNYKFTNTVMIDGAGYKWTNVKGSQRQMPKPDGTLYPLGVGHTGNGYAKITYLGNN